MVVRVLTLAAFVAAWVLTSSVAFLVMSRSAEAAAAAEPAPRASPSGDLAFSPEDLRFILNQIRIAERHVAGEELRDIIPNSTLPWGLRTVDGSYNNLIPGQEHFGAADELFGIATTRTFPDAQALTTLSLIHI